MFHMPIKRLFENVYLGGAAYPREAIIKEVNFFLKFPV